MNQWLKSHRIQVASSLGLLGELLMCVAGIIGVYHHGITLTFGMLTLAGFMGLYAHSIVLLLGKTKIPKPAAVTDKKSMFSLKALARPFMVWRYPMDSSYALFTLTGFAYYLSGLSAGNPALILLGCFTLTAASIGWVWPQEKAISGYAPAQICAGLLLVGALAAIAAGILGYMPVVIAAGVTHILANILPFVFKPSVPAAAAPASAEDEQDIKAKA